MSEVDPNDRPRARPNAQVRSGRRESPDPAEPYQAEPAEIPPPQPLPDPPGNALDMSVVRDQQLVRQAVKKNWPLRWRGLTPEFKARIMTGMDKATQATIEALDGENPMDAAKTMSSLARTAAAIEEQVQKDEHLEDKNARIDAGLATERVGLAPVIIEKPLPPPEES